MKYILFIAIISLVALSSCGGTIGNIERYRFKKTTIAELKAIVEKVNSKHPEFRQFDRNKYVEGNSGLNDGNFYCTVDSNGTKYLLIYGYVFYDNPDNPSSEIVLVSAAKYGEPIYLADDISYLKKIQYRKLFETHFIEAIRTEIQ